MSRTDRLIAAHWIVSITGFFEAVDEHLKALGVKDLGTSASKRVAL